MESNMTKANFEEIHATLALLCERFPKCFSIYERRRKPLKCGIDKDLAVALDGALTPTEINAALRHYIGNPCYQRAMSVAGTPRIDLDGNVAGGVTAAQAQAAWLWLRHLEQKIAARKAAITLAKKAAEEALKPRRLSLGDLKAAAVARRTARSLAPHHNG